MAKGRWYNNDSFIKDNNLDEFKISLVDSNHIHLHGGDGWGKDEEFYARAYYDNYHDNLIKSLEGDSMRKKLIGWWKLVASKAPVEFLNYSGFYNKFTVNFGSDGQAIFYLENKFDSTVDYSYSVNPDGISIRRYCLIEPDCKIFFNSAGQMKLILDRRADDTLLLQRLTDIR